MTTQTTDSASRVFDVPLETINRESNDEPEGSQTVAAGDLTSEEAVPIDDGSGDRSLDEMEGARRLEELPIKLNRSTLVERVYVLDNGLFAPNNITWNLDLGTPQFEFKIRIDVNIMGSATSAMTSVNGNRENPGGLGDRINMQMIPTEFPSLALGLDTFYVLEWHNTTTNKVQVLVSPVFTVISDAEDLDDVKKELEDRIAENPHLENGYVPEDARDILPPGSRYDPADPDTTGLPPSVSTQTSISPANGANGANEQKAVSGGLATSAKIGIGVACAVVGISIIILIAFLLLRRRRKRRGGDHVRSIATYDASPHGGANDYVADKETNGTRVAESPYTDDGRGSALLVAAQDQDRSFATYSDGPPHAITADTRIESRMETRGESGVETRIDSVIDSTQAPPPPPPAAAAASTQESAPAENAQPVPPPQGDWHMTSAVAHLVEDGMTEEQIRRLEEEERALDRAIEQAGHSNR